MPADGADLPDHNCLVAEAVSAADSLRDCAARSANLRVFAWDNTGSEHFISGPRGRRVNEQIFGWSEETERWWTAKGVTFLSPVTIGARYESEPFWCNGDGFYTRVPNPALSSVDLSKFEQYTGCKAAIVVPVHLTFGRIAAVSFHPNDRDRNDLSDDFNQYKEQLEQCARCFINAYVRAAEAKSPSLAHKLLSQREVECLQWAALGKTDSEIAQILARSHPTIRFHVRRSMEKLDAVNRSQAIFKATQLGYLV